MQFPMTKDEVSKFGAKWEEPVEPHYENIISGDDLPDAIDQVSDEITKQRILCPETKQMHAAFPPPTNSDYTRQTAQY